MCQTRLVEAPLHHRCEGALPVERREKTPFYNLPQQARPERACADRDGARGLRRQGRAPLDLTPVFSADVKRRERLLQKCVKRLVEANEEYDTDLFWFLRPSKVYALFSSRSPSDSPGSSCPGSGSARESPAAIEPGFVLRDDVRGEMMTSLSDVDAKEILRDEVRITLEPDVVVPPSQKRPRSTLWFSKASQDVKTQDLQDETISLFEKVLLVACILVSIYLLISLAVGGPSHHSDQLRLWSTLSPLTGSAIVGTAASS
eukprot:CAMPEP_0185850840 /NCGR_PEP_ID=MMETSP1354-20130828/4820_1 /TAXON_ID=708628 /ORGANISM="Erythrolobus madagascarensis, Strain CCMP3276" /LENGTH=259 /DNA_ID=CAMNT_0028551565 /DNA_START=148 /DNA_END=927 /DNA_ORIENTATION=-